jgi:hypothetical protein
MAVMLALAAGAPRAAASDPPASPGPASPATPGQPPSPAGEAEPGKGASDDPKPETSPATATAQDAQATADPDARLNPGQPEFTVVNLPTTLRLPRNRFAFRVSHRFTRDLTQGGLDDLLADFFGFDGGARIGLELRYGLMRNWQIGICRTGDRTIEFFTQYNVLKQGERMPFTVDALATIEGTNNFNDEDLSQPTGEGVRSPALGAVVSWVAGRSASINATFAWVNNTNPLPSELVDHNDTVLLGLAGRLRIRPTVYVVAEITPRLGGDTPGSTLASFGIEKRVGGHAFQINFSNGIATTLAQVARGGTADQWYIGFNINRKFF